MRPRQLIQANRVWQFLPAVWLILAGNLARGQTPYLDSVIRVYRTSKIDTIKCDAALKAAYVYVDINPDSAIFYANKSKRIAVNIKDKMREAGALSELGWEHLAKGNYKTSIKCYREALAIDRKLNDKASVLADLGNLGVVYKEQGDFASALKVCYESLRILESLETEIKREKNANKRKEKEKKVKTEKETLLTTIGNTYRHLKQLEKALSFHKKALALAKVVDNKKAISRVKGNIGAIYFDKHDYKTAMVYFSEALAVATEINDHHQIA
ncbi:MAG TPA: tetratricopeptide repeat protein, partial [Flavobacteriales bacterium]|nr:tetratricopeptide repeat protein [Flavobacteriales bacterium]